MTSDVTHQPGAAPAGTLPDSAVLLAAGLSQQPVTPDQRVALAARMLERFPNADVSAIDDRGRFVAMPAHVPLNGQQLVAGHETALELVEPQHIPGVIDAWKDATTNGIGAARADLLGQPGSEFELCFVDTREQYGVLLGFFLTADGGALPSSRGADDQLRPRLAIVRKSALAEFVEVDEAFSVLLGYSPQDIIGVRNLELVHPDQQQQAIANWVDMLGRGGSVQRVRLRHRHADGHWIWFEVTNHNRLDDPAERCVVAEMIDISDEMAAHESLRASQQLLARLTDALPVGVVQLDTERRVVYTNAAAGTILGIQDAQTLDDVVGAVHADDRFELASACRAVLGSAADVGLEVGIAHPGRGQLRCRLTLRPLTSASDITGAIVCIDDVTEPARLRAQLEFRAAYDELTGCLSRAALLNDLESALDEARRQPGGGTAVVYIDLDGFKSVNDTRGHAAGDALLSEIGRSLKRSARRGDVVGRVGGDEFLVICRQVESSETALAIGQRLADGLAARIKPQPGYGAVASVGVAWAPVSATRTADQLVASADRAMYESKREGRGRPVLDSGAPPTPRRRPRRSRVAACPVDEVPAAGPSASAGP